MASISYVLVHGVSQARPSGVPGNLHPVTLQVGNYGVIAYLGAAEIVELAELVGVQVRIQDATKTKALLAAQLSSSGRLTLEKHKNIIGV